MLIPKKIRIIRGTSSDLPRGLSTQIMKSAQDALKYEKSVRILPKQASEQPDYILHVGAATPALLKQYDTRGLAKIIPVPVPSISTCTSPHSLNTGESLHGYFTLGGDLLSLHHLPARKNQLNLGANSLMTPPSTEKQKLAGALRAKFSLQGPWHAVVAGPNALEVHSYAAPDLTALFSALGANWYSLLTFEAAGKPVSILPQNIGGTIIFAPNKRPRLRLEFRRLYLDLDDTLIVHGAINPHAMRLLKACNEQNVDVHLITRHAGDLPSTLKAYGIEEGLFSSIIWIKDKSPKSSHMTPDGAIFIDDSFQERLEVSCTRTSSVFPPEAASILMI